MFAANSNVVVTRPTTCTRFSQIAPQWNASITPRIKTWSTRPSNKRRITLQSYEDDRQNDLSPSSSVPEAVPTVDPESDWRAFRAKLIAASSGSPTTTTTDTSPSQSWAHEIKTPEVGCLLLANPLYFMTSQSYFQQSVILIIAHDSQGSIGVIINKPTQHHLRDFKTNLGSEFDDCTLYLGGDVGEMDHVTFIHPVASTTDSTQLIPGVYLSSGNFHGLQSALANGQTTTDQIKVMTMYAGWGPGQLISEVNRGVWMVAAASHDVVLSSTPTMSKGDELWHNVLKLMGGEFAGLSAAVKGEYRADIMGEIRGNGIGGGTVSDVARQVRNRENGECGGSNEQQNNGSGI